MCKSIWFCLTCSTFTPLYPFHVACGCYYNKLWVLYNTLWVWELYLQLLLNTGILQSIWPVWHTSNCYLLMFSVYCFTCSSWNKTNVWNDQKRLRWFQQYKQIENQTIIKEVVGIYVWSVWNTSNYYLLIFSVYCSTWNKTNVWNAINIHSN